MPKLKVQAPHDTAVARSLPCKITLGPLTIDTAANVDQVAALILALVRGYSELPQLRAHTNKLT